MKRTIAFLAILLCGFISALAQASSGPDCAHYYKEDGKIDLPAGVFAQVCQSSGGVSITFRSHKTDEFSPVEVRLNLKDGFATVGSVFAEVLVASADGGSAVREFRQVKSSLVGKRFEATNQTFRRADGSAFMQGTISGTNPRTVGKIVLVEFLKFQDFNSFHANTASAEPEN